MSSPHKNSSSSHNGTQSSSISQIQKKPSLFIRFIKGTVFQVFVFFTTVILLGVGYAAWTSLNVSQGADGQPVTQTLMQGMINNINDLNTRVNALNPTPSGAIMAFNLATCPTGWTAANGTSGTPDLRGEFVRGLDSGRGIDVGRTLGSNQNGTVFRNHISNALMQEDAWILNLDMGGVDPGWNGNTISQVAPTNFTFPYGNPGIRGTSRPRNIALLYCQKQ